MRSLISLKLHNWVLILQKYLRLEIYFSIVSLSFTKIINILKFTSVKSLMQEVALEAMLPLLLRVSLIFWVLLFLIVVIYSPSSGLLSPLQPNLQSFFFPLKVLFCTLRQVSFYSFWFLPWVFQWAFSQNRHQEELAPLQDPTIS